MSRFKFPSVDSVPSPPPDEWVRESAGFRTGTSPHFSPGFGILGRSGKADWSIARRGIAGYGSRGIGQAAKPEWAEDWIGQGVDSFAVPRDREAAVQRRIFFGPESAW